MFTASKNGLDMFGGVDMFGDKFGDVSMHKEWPIPRLLPRFRTHLRINTNCYNLYNVRKPVVYSVEGVLKWGAI